MSDASAGKRVCATVCANFYVNVCATVCATAPKCATVNTTVYAKVYFKFCQLLTWNDYWPTSPKEYQKTHKSLWALSHCLRYSFDIHSRSIFPVFQKCKFFFTFWFFLHAVQLATYNIHCTAPTYYKIQPISFVVINVSAARHVFWPGPLICASVGFYCTPCLPHFPP